jgi:hypothetical protein
LAVRGETTEPGCEPVDDADATCNGVDDDCDGAVDELEGEPCYSGPEGTRGVGACKAGQPACGEDGTQRCAGEVVPAAAEACNGVDDDCDGTVDEGFVLETDDAHCGRCDNACTPDHVCIAGQCERRVELACTDDVDNDNDGPKDCADADCRGVSCGEGSVCNLQGACGEGLCGNGVNDDGDALTDCADVDDCEGASCGTGCTCTGGVAKETDCADGLDNDNNKDGADCADPDCTSCGTGCVCTGGVAKELDCADGLDNDQDGSPDCEDDDCNGQQCGSGCQCVSPNAVESNCADDLDNDNDTLKDCADVQDCPVNKQCLLAGGGGFGKCGPARKCVP